jgi:hypothetical protein
MELVNVFAKQEHGMDVIEGMEILESSKMWAGLRAPAC